MANTVKDHMSLYLPYLTSITAQIAIICNYFFANYLGRPLKAEGYLKRHKKVLEVICSVAATFFVAVIPVMLYKASLRINSVLVVIVGTWIAYILNFMMNKYYRGVKNDIFEYRRRFVSAAIGVACVFLLQKFISV
jgi:glucan phosphoethanolaminetransferase (alkaline phosphatase superfamily)